MQLQLAAPCGELGNKVAVVPVGGAGDILQRKIQLQQLGVGGVPGVLFQPVLQGRVHRPQGSRQGGGQLLQKHGAVLCIQRLRQCKARVGVHRQQAGLHRFGLGGRGTAAGRGLRTGFARCQKYPVGAGQRGLEAAFAPAQRPFGLGQAAFAELRRVHGACPVRQVMGLIDEEQPVSGGIKKAL